MAMCFTVTELQFVAYNQEDIRGCTLPCKGFDTKNARRVNECAVIAKNTGSDIFIYEDTTSACTLCSQTPVPEREIPILRWGYVQGKLIYGQGQNIMVVFLCIITLSGEIIRVIKCQK